MSWGVVIAGIEGKEGYLIRPNRSAGFGRRLLVIGWLYTPEILELIENTNLLMATCYLDKSYNFRDVELVRFAHKTQRFTIPKFQYSIRLWKWQKP